MEQDIHQDKKSDKIEQVNQQNKKSDKIEQVNQQNKKGKIDLIIGSMFSGKCIGMSTRVINGNGRLVPAFSLEVGDILSGPNGCSIIRSININRGVLYRVYLDLPSNIYSFLVTENHVLVLYSQAGSEILVSVKEYLKYVENTFDNIRSEFFKNLQMKNYNNELSKITIVISQIGLYSSFSLIPHDTFYLEDGWITHNSTELIRRIKRYEIAGKKCIVVKYAKDNRYSDKLEIITHDLNESKLKSDIISCESLTEIEDKIKDVDIIGIDEGQFIKNLHLIDKWATDYKKTIIVSALDADYLRKPFESITQLVPKSESVKKLKAVCKCGENASFTKRIIESIERELIGGSESYKAVCRNCYYE